jgi:hypothetical protein
MFTFDFTTHLRYDILVPRGPIKRDLEPLDEAHLTPSVSWLLGGIPKMQRDLPKSLEGPIALVLTGPAATAVVLNPLDAGIVVEEIDSHNRSALATVISATTDFLAWSTTRLPWREHVTIEGDGFVATKFLDALNLT